MCSTNNTIHFNCQGFMCFDVWSLCAAFFSLFFFTTIALWLPLGYWRRNLCFCTWNSLCITNFNHSAIVNSIDNFWMWVCVIPVLCGYKNSEHIFFLVHAYSCCLIFRESKERQPLALKIRKFDSNFMRFNTLLFRKKNYRVFLCFSKKKAEQMKWTSFCGMFADRFSEWQAFAFHVKHFSTQHIMQSLIQLIIKIYKFCANTNNVL